MSVSLETVKSVPVQLSAGDENPSVDSHRCVRTTAWSTDESTGHLVLLLVAIVFLTVPIPLHLKDVARVVHVLNTS